MEEFSGTYVVHRRSLRKRLLIALAAAVAVAVGYSFVSPELFLRGAWLPFLVALRFFDGDGHLEAVTADVRASRSGVLVDGKPAVVPEKVAEVVYEPAVENEHALADRGGVVRFRDAQRRQLLAVAVRDGAEADALLRAVGADVDARTSFGIPALFAQRNWFIWVPAFLFFPGIMPGNGAGGIITLAQTVGLLASLVAVWMLLRGRRIHVGSSIEITSAVFKQRVYPEELEYVLALPENGLRLVCRGVKSIDLSVGPARVLEGGRLVSLRDVLIARIERARVRARQRAESRGVAAQLARGTRSAESWSADLRRLREANGAYRATAIREGDLWNVVEDPMAPEDARAAAALLVARDAPDRARIRVALEEVESPRLRVALERIVADGGDPIDDVVAQLAEERARARTRGA